LIFNNAYKNVSPSQYLKDAFEGLGYSNIHYIPNTIELEKYQFKIRKIDKVKLLWVRSFSKIYNPLLAVRLLKSLLDDGIDASLCMVGPDSDGTFKKTKLLAKRLKVDVRFTGKLTKTVWIELSQDYNVFINTTNFDNMPVSVIEAMALGISVVSTNVGGMPYLIKNNFDGILVEPNNSQLFVEAIKGLMADQSDTDRLVKNARYKVEQYDWNVVKQQWYSVLTH
jgi:glycosyltransferase involved in cell wall biosynthesis